MSGGLKQRITLSFLVVWLLIAALGVGAWLGVRRITSRAESLKGESVKVAGHLAELKTAVAGLRQYYLELAATPEDRGLPGGGSEEKQFRALFEKNFTALKKLSAENAQATDLRDTLGSIRKEFDRFDKLGQTMVVTFKEDGSEDGMFDLRRFQPQATALLDRLNKLEMDRLRRFENTLGEMESLGEQITVLNFSLNAVALVLTLLVAGGLIRAVVSPLRRLTQEVSRVADGDLTLKVQRGRGKDEISQLAGSVGRMVESLSKMVGSIAHTVRELQAVGHQASEASRKGSDVNIHMCNMMVELSGGAASQTTSVEETRMAVQDATRLMASVVENSRAVSTSTEEARHMVNEGAQNAEDAVDNMMSIQQNVTRTAEVVERLGQRTRRINTIVEMITAVAEQTNLLALNAAIEAARAGDHGAGFAVVAEEVRKLAEESTSAAQEIVKLIKEIQLETVEASESMKSQTAVVEEGVKAVQKAGISFDTIRDAVGNIVEQTGQIHEATEAMNEQNKRVVDAIANVSFISARTSAASEEASGFTDELGQAVLGIAEQSLSLEKMAADLKEQVERFKLA